ncbi:MAG: DNA repair protein RecO [Piscirickettsiaceae bacterium]|nr:DNA repair protein RecO [Piscirickettsiaceae bacterium]
MVTGLSNLNVEFASAFILHQRPYRETSLLLDVFSEKYGRISLVAKGVRKKKRSQSGILQLYQPLILSWLGRGDLQTMISAEAMSARYQLTAESALCGLYINELMVRLLPVHVAEPEIFKAYEAVLSGLQDADNTEIVLRLFEKRVLMHLGYGLVLDREAETGRLINDSLRYTYQADVGLALAQENNNQHTISGRSLQHLLMEQYFDKQSLKEIKQLMRSVIHFYLGDKPLKSRQLFAELQHYAKG